MNFDHILIIGFGGPEKPEDVRPFIETVVKGARIPEERLKEVEGHYEAIGGKSPYNAYTRQLFQKLETRLRDLKIKLPMFLGMKNWHPFLKETVQEIKRRKLKRGIGVILAPHRSEASFEKYVLGVEEAKTSSEAKEISYEYVRPWHDHPLFIKAQADEARKVMDKNGSKNLHIIFTAHSIPVAMAQKSRYAEEFKTSSAFVAKELNMTNWSLAYQSRSGNPRDPWLAPDVISMIGELKIRGIKRVLLVPVGFLCDNAEVLYDLDVETAEAASEMGIGYARARTVTDHPSFVEMLAELIQEKLAGS